MVMVGFIIDINFTPSNGDQLNHRLWDALDNIREGLSSHRPSQSSRESFTTTEIKNAIDRIFTLNNTFNGPLLRLLKQIHNTSPGDVKDDFLRVSQYFPPSLINLKQAREELFVPYKYIDSMIINETVKERNRAIMGFQEYDGVGKMTFVVSRACHDDARASTLACLTALRELGIDTKDVKSVNIIDVPLDVCKACLQFLPLERDEMKMRNISKDEKSIFEFAEKYKKKHHLLFSLYKQNEQFIPNTQTQRGGMISSTNKRRLDDEGLGSEDNTPQKLPKYEEGGDARDEEEEYVNEENEDDENNVDDEDDEEDENDVEDDEDDENDIEDEEDEEDENDIEEEDEEDEDYETEEEEEEEDEEDESEEDDDSSEVEIIEDEDSLSMTDKDYVEGEDDDEGEEEEEEDGEEEEGEEEEEESDFPMSEEIVSDASEASSNYVSLKEEASCTKDQSTGSCTKDLPTGSQDHPAFVYDLGQLLQRHFPEVPSDDRMHYSHCIWKDMSDMNLDRK